MIEEGRLGDWGGSWDSWDDEGPESVPVLDPRSRPRDELEVDAGSVKVGTDGCSDTGVRRVRSNEARRACAWICSLGRGGRSESDGMVCGVSGSSR